MKCFLLTISVCFVNTLSATNYYFSNISGDDNRTSAQAANPSTPWKTITKLNSFFSSLQPGDSALFKRGEVFYGSITVNKSGSTKPIVIGAYGLGNRPQITTLVTLSGWQANSSYSGVYDCAPNSALGSQLNMVVVNDVEEGIGRYPNSDAANKGYLTLESHSGNVSITDKQLPSAPNWKGAEVVIRTSHWTLDRSLITSQSGSTISYKALPGAYNARDNYGYFIQNDIRTLDQFGEWYYNASTKKVSMYFGSQNPASFTIKAAALDNLVYSNNQSNVVFDNITFKGANAEGIHINGGSNMAVQNSDIIFSGSDGLNVTGSGFRLENSAVLNSNNDGVDLGRGSAPVIRNNIVRNSYFIPGMGGSGNGNGAGIRNGDRGIVEYNQVINSGYMGVFLGGNNAIIKNNYIDSFCNVKDDAGGIYTANGSNTTYTGRKITGNIMFHAVGASEGTDNITGFPSAQGIYMDDNANGVEITDNTVANCNRGIFLHNSRDMVIKNNTIFDNISAQLYMKHDALGSTLKNHTITNNIFFSKLPTQLAASFNSTLNDISSIGRLDSNYYARPIDDRLVISNTTYLYASNQSIINLDLKGWEAKYSKDLTSKGSAKEIAPYNVTSLTGSSKINNGNFTSNNISSIWGNKCSLSWQNAGLLDGGYLKVTPSSANSSIVLSLGALSSAKKYILKYSLKGTSGSISAYLRSSNYVSLTPGQLRTVSATRSENEMMFTPSRDDSNGSLVLTIDVQSTYYIDNIQVYEANATVTNPDDSIRFLYNPSQVITTTLLDGNYVDVKGTQYSNSIALQPYASAVLIKADAPLNMAASPTIVSLTSPLINSTYYAPAAIYLSATASSTSGISKVEFYNGTVLVGTQNAAPYGTLWKNVSTGNYNLTAVATDNVGTKTTSGIVSVSVLAGSLMSAVSSGAAIQANVNNPSIMSAQDNLARTDNLKLVGFNLFPNPAVDNINVAFDNLQNYQKANVSIQTASGMAIKRFPVVISGKNLMLDISSLSAGIYVFSLETDNFKITKKFIKISK